MKKERIARYYNIVKTLKDFESEIDLTNKKIKSLYSDNKKHENQKTKLENKLKNIKTLVYCKKCDKVYPIKNLISERYIEMSTRMVGHGDHDDYHSSYSAYDLYKCKKCKSALAYKHSKEFRNQEQLEKEWDIQNILIINNVKKFYDLCNLKKLW